MFFEFSHTSKRREALTLVELVVVIGLVSLLLSLLMPALRGARDSARTIQCINNVRQIMHGSLLYAGDNDETLPPWRNWDPGPMYSYYYPDMIAKYVKTTQIAYLTRLTTDPGIYRSICVCPGNMNGEAWDPFRWSLSSGSDKHSINFGYGMNYEVTTTALDVAGVNDSTTPCRGRKLSTIIKYDLKPGYACTYIGASGGGLNFVVADPGGNGPSYVHRGKSSVAFLDGHVQLMNQQELSAIPNWTYPDR